MLVTTRSLDHHGIVSGIYDELLIFIMLVTTRSLDHHGIVSGIYDELEIGMLMRGITEVKVEIDSKVITKITNMDEVKDKIIG
ncbi:hypothetical protein [Methanosarcina barkeri]|uniref:Mobile element protein n=1 Tax=Methanosarcina barkeri 227 TaxID=1434106 RepID=A0A0E3LPY5_METBA|nr:hypothetical protein [Methanosarcina barkeri]AKB57331.1 Mobile element protein [Methanosarcina barkeri 227]